MPQTKDESKPYRYVGTFKEVAESRLSAEMEKDELQTYINQLLGAKGLDNAITESKPKKPRVAYE